MSKNKPRPPKCDIFCILQGNIESTENRSLPASGIIKPNCVYLRTGTWNNTSWTSEGRTLCPTWQLLVLEWKKDLPKERSHTGRMQLQTRFCRGQIWLTEAAQWEYGESRDRFGKQGSKNVLDSWHINTKSELCSRLSVLHSTWEGAPWLNRSGMCTFTDHYVLYGLSRQRELKLQKLLIKAPSFFYNSRFKARRSDWGVLWELAGFLSWSWYGHGFAGESESLTGAFTAS